MLIAEKRARQTGQVSPAATKSEDEPNMEDLSPVHNAPLRWYNAVIPIVIVIITTIYRITSYNVCYTKLLRDWVVVYFYGDDDHREGQRTVVTESQGPLRGRRVVRGRETECRVYYLTHTPSDAASEKALSP